MTSRLKIALVIVAVIAFTITAALVVILQRQSTGHATQDKLVKIVTGVQQTNRFIKDCTDPNGECYQQSQANQAAVLGRVQDIFVDVAALTVVCARESGNVTVEQVKACVAAGLR